MKRGKACLPKKCGSARQIIGANGSLYQRTGDERVTAVEDARAEWRAANPQKVAAFDAALEANMERNEITEGGGFVARMNALRDAYVRCFS